MPSTQFIHVVMESMGGKNKVRELTKHMENIMMSSAIGIMFIVDVMLCPSSLDSYDQSHQTIMKQNQLSSCDNMMVSF